MVRKFNKYGDKRDNKYCESLKASLQYNFLTLNPIIIVIRVIVMYFCVVSMFDTRDVPLYLFVIHFLGNTLNIARYSSVPGTLLKYNSTLNCVNHLNIINVKMKEKAFQSNAKPPAWRQYKLHGEQIITHPEGLGPCTKRTSPAYGLSWTERQTHQTENVTFLKLHCRPLTSAVEVYLSDPHHISDVH